MGRRADLLLPARGRQSARLPRLAGRLGDDAEIVAICRPGREHRAAEPAPTIGEYIDGAAGARSAAAARADHRPCYLFGHSLGALIAFEVGRSCAGTGRAAASLRRVRLLGARACCRRSGCSSIATLSGREFAEAIGFFGGLSAEVIADDEMRELLLPGMIADFRMAVGYRYQPATPLDVPATIVVGRDDPHVRAAQAEPWSREFAAAGRPALGRRRPLLLRARPGDDHRASCAEIVQADQHVELI